MTSTRRLINQVMIEGYLSSLSCPGSDLDSKVRDRFPKTLREAFQLSVLLESNSLYHSSDSKRDHHVVDARAGSMSSNVTETESELEELRREVRRLKEEQRSSLAEGHVRGSDRWDSGAEDVGRRDKSVRAGKMSSEGGPGESIQPNDITEKESFVTMSELRQLSKEVQRLQSFVIELMQRQVKDDMRDEFALLKKQVRQFTENCSRPARDHRCEAVRDSACTARDHTCERQQRAVGCDLDSEAGGRKRSRHVKRRKQRVAKSDIESGDEQTVVKRVCRDRDTYMFTGEKSASGAAEGRDSVMVSLNGSEPTAILIDSGGSHCLCPTSLTNGASLQPTDVTLRACNRTPLSVAGTLRMDVSFLRGRKKVRKQVDFVVCNDIDMPVLGQPFINAFISSWNVRDGFVLVDGVKLPTVTRDGDTQSVTGKVAAVSACATAAAAGSGHRDGGQFGLDQYDDADIGPLYEMLQKNEPITFSVVRNATSCTMRGYARQRDHLILRDGVLYRKWVRSGGQDELLTVVPKVRQRQMMQEAHVSSRGEHFSVGDTCQRLKNTYYWYAMPSHVTDFVSSCCQCRLVRMAAEGGKPEVRGPDVRRRSSTGVQSA